MVLSLRIALLPDQCNRVACIPWPIVAHTIPDVIGQIRLESIEAAVEALVSALGLYARAIEAVLT